MLTSEFLSSYRTLRLLALVVFCLLVAGIVETCHKKPTDSGDEQPPGERTWLQTQVDVAAAWSPDGSKIVYHREPADAGKDTSWQFGAFIHNMATGHETCLWPNVIFDGFTWSPDSRKLAVVQRGQVYIYDFDSDTLHRITYRNQSYSPSWSPCGDRIVFFDRFNYVGMQIYDLSMDSVLNIVGEDRTFAGDWMPDCSTLVVIDSARYSEGKLYAYNLYSDALWLISDKPGYKTSLAVSPDGKTVVFTVHYNLWTVPTSGGEPHQLTTEGGEFPDWSPDGQWIVYTKDNHWNGYLWLMRPDGSEKHQLTF